MSKIFKIIQSYPKIIRKYSKLSKIIYIYVYIYIWISGTSTRLALVTSRRDLDVTKHSRDNPTPKKRMLGLTPSIFFRVEPPKTPKRVFGDPQNLYICGVGAEDDKKKGITFLSAI